MRQEFPSGAPVVIVLEDKPQTRGALVNIPFVLKIQTTGTIRLETAAKGRVLRLKKCPQEMTAVRRQIIQERIVCKVRTQVK